VLPEKMVNLDQVIASSPVIVLWGEPFAHRPVDFITSNVDQFGYTVPEMVLEETPFFSVVLPDDREHVRQEFADAMERGDDFLVSDYRIVTRSGDIRWVEDRIAFHRDDEGRAVLYQSSLLDITDRKIAEMRLRESEERLARVLASSHVGVWEYLPERDEITGPGRASIFGMREREVPVSRSALWDRIIPPSARADLERMWRDIADGRLELLDREHEIIRGDGSSGWVLTKGFPVRDENGALLSMQGVTVDITSLKNAERKLLRQNRHLALLHDISLAFMEELDTEMLVRRILESAVELAGAGNGVISILDDEGKNLIHRWGVGFHTWYIGKSRNADTGFFGEVLRERRMKILRDYRTYGNRMTDPILENVTTIICLPLQRGGRLLGIIGITYVDEIPEIDESLPALLDQFAASASIALENARLYEDSLREVEERKKAEERLRFHQALVEAAAEGASFLLSLESTDQAMLFALRALGDAMDARRTVLFRNSADPHDGLVAEVMKRAVVSEGQEKILLPQRLIWKKDLLKLYPLLSKGVSFHGSLSSIGGEDSRLASLDPSVTVTAIPILIKSAFWGFLVLCFDEERAPFETDEIDVLRAAAYNLAASVIRWESEHEVKQGYEKLRKTFSDVIRTMGQIVGKKDPYTIEHQERVGVLASAIAGKMGFDEERCEGIRIAGLVHDVGKIEIPGEILSKPGKLSAIEFELIKTHARSGYDILREVEFPWPVAEIAHQHHERMDGSGYPRGLRGDEILPEARILTVADVVESMVSHRPYRPSLGIEAARKEIVAKRGVLYDPEVVDACLALLEERPGIIPVQ